MAVPVCKVAEALAAARVYESAAVLAAAPGCKTRVCEAAPALLDEAAIPASAHGDTPTMSLLLRASSTMIRMQHRRARSAWRLHAVLTVADAVDPADPAAEVCRCARTVPPPPPLLAASKLKLFCPAVSVDAVEGAKRTEWIPGSDSGCAAVDAPLLRGTLTVSPLAPPAIDVENCS